MSFNHPKAGPNSVPAYQLSGIPFVTGSTNGTETITRKQFENTITIFVPKIFFFLVVFLSQILD